MADMPAGTTFCTFKGKLGGFASDGSDVNNDPDFVPLAGTVTCQPMIPGQGYVVDIASQTLIFGEPIVQKLAADGSFSMEVVATDSPNLTPSGWYYRLTVVPNVGSPLSAKISAPGGKTLNLTDLLAGTAAFPALDASLVQVGQGAPTASTPGNFYLDASTDDVWINA